MENASSLPDEIIREILMPALHVPEESFSWMSMRSSPFATHELSSSAVLLVCKSWLRVATPLLYHTVVIRSIAQAQSLAVALKGNSELGRFIQKLRIEGGYGASIHEIFKRSPNVTDLCLNLNLRSNENIKGYLTGLRLINPQRLLFCGGEVSRKSSVRDQTCKALAQAIRDSWNRLTMVYLAALMWGRFPQEWNVIIEALLTSNVNCLELTMSSNYSPRLIDLMKLPTVRTIRVHIDPGLKPESNALSGHTWIEGRLLGAMGDDRTLYDKTEFVSNPPVFKKTDVELHSRPLNPNYIPLSNASKEDRTFIWTRILRYAMNLNAIAEVTGRSLDLPNDNWTRSRQRSQQIFRAKLPLVSKEFHEYAIPLLYEVPLVQNEKNVRQLAISPHTRFIKCIYLDAFLGGSSMTVMESLIAACSNLSSVSHFGSIYVLEISDFSALSAYITSKPFAIPPSAILFLSKHSAGTLRHMHLPLSMRNCDSRLVGNACESLARFRDLRSLIIGTFDVQGLDQSFSLSLPADALPALERLGVTTGDCLLSNVILESLSHVNLPSLRRLDLLSRVTGEKAITFLQAHGKKLIHLRANGSISNLFSELCPQVMQWCPILLDQRMDNFSCLSALPKENQIPLTTITICDSRLEPKDLEDLISRDFSPLKYLREIKLHMLLWPAINEREIAKSPWVPLAEAVLKDLNIKLTDSQGQGWTPRLKAASRRRK